jgi:hypothetical protein
MMTAHQQVLELLFKKLQERVEDTTVALQSGAAKDFADYKDLCGVVRGLGLAQMEINDLLRKLKDIDNDD